MRLAILSARSDIHTVRWVNALSERGHDVHLLTMHPGGDPLDDGVQVHRLRVPAPLGYVLNALHLRRLLKRLRPDLLHAHFASGYGTLGRLAGYHPYVLSVWGRDVYEFPYRSRLHEWFLRGNLRAADHVCSTSHVMAEQTRSLCPEIDEISVTPFGIDTDTFRPEDEDGSERDDDIVIGTVKKLNKYYGIDILIQSFAKMREEVASTHPSKAAKLRLVIVGGGPERGQLQKLSRALDVDSVTTFVGPVPHAGVPAQLDRLDVYVAASRTESFGVAVLEASACGVPVVVSTAGGLPEVVEAGETGLIVEREDVEATAAALKRLVLDREMRARMGAAGRRHVLGRYQWADSVSTMEAVYAHVA